MNEYDKLFIQSFLCNFIKYHLTYQQSLIILDKFELCDDLINNIFKYVKQETKITIVTENYRDEWCRFQQNLIGLNQWWHNRAISVARRVNYSASFPRKSSF